MPDKVTKEAKNNKRPRVVLACNRCRQRKTKCDGGQPACGSCVKRNAECVYGTKYARARVTVEYVRRLEERLGIASKTRHESMAPSINNIISIEEPQKSPSPQESPPNREPSIEHAATSMSPSSSKNSTSSGFRSSKYSTSAMGAGEMSKQKRGRDRDYYGSSAAISFMKELSNVIDGPSRSDTTDDDEVEIRYKMSRFEPSSSMRISRLDLPTRAIADVYVKNYFEFAYTLYPFVHIPTFMATYESLWNNGVEVDELFYSIVNIIFAFGCQLAPTSQRLEDYSELYFERSQKFLRFHLMDSGSILLVQALLLTGQFLQASSGSAGCWNIVGLAIRIAQGLGLHSDQNYASTKSLIDREIRKRLWQGCLVMDRIVSMTMGRPMMVSHVQGEVPLCVDDEYIKDDAISPMKDPPRLGFFSQTIKLYDILADILKSVYSNDQLDENPKLLSNIFKFEDRLNEFTANLPSHLQFSSDLQKMMPFERQSIVLHIRVLHLKISLYRPILFAKNPNSNGSELYTSTKRSVALLCLNLAIELINVISKYRAGDIVYLPAHWYNVFYIYTAGTVLLAAKLSVGLHKDIDMVAFEQAWNSGLDILRSYTQQSESASRCLKVLEMMGKKVQISSQRLATQANTPDETTDDRRLADVYPLYSPSSTSSEVPIDVLYSLLYDTAGPFGGPFHGTDDLSAFYLR
ncbi:hypothetical protein I9W82_004195 [Candida metapsilosis]|uniref:Zn(2)-C6 fungal-type domain-containing protein n=1 Tax=Candida metapsilosis TaxID=273372 RepID=A0A8H7ZHD1_9ASCO|nr:hypothetical protein I9W82_004195 [Candida metapsilosis]